MKNIRLAIVEDDQDIHDLLAAFFRPKGFLIKAYDSGAAFLKDVETDRAQFDVILSDLNMPRMNGIELVETARAMGVSAPIILITAHQSAEVAVKAIQAGAYDFVVKPIHFPQLLCSVERAIYLSQVKSENEALKQAVTTQNGTNFDGIIVKSPAFRRSIDLAKKVANSMANVFLSGETGTGKEVIARSIHNYSDRAGGPFVAINCSAIPEHLLESELFGHAKGAFTGASDKKTGLFEEAAKGTLFLDEIGDLSLPLQAKLLRVLQEKKIKRVGENQLRPIDVRIISATHKDLGKETKEQRFRDDLFFRLNVIPISIPPLRERREDILPLAEFFLKKYAALNGKRVLSCSKPALDFLLSRKWSGNVRELENVMERAVVLCNQSTIELEDVCFESADSAQAAVSGKETGFSFAAFEGDGEKIRSLDALTNQYVLYALKKNQGAKDKTARDLGIDRKTLYRRISEMERVSISQ
jgi:two-component system, NtrC family, response regulator HydG